MEMTECARGANLSRPDVGMDGGPISQQMKTLQQQKQAIQQHKRALQQQGIILAQQEAGLSQQEVLVKEQENILANHVATLQRDQSTAAKQTALIEQQEKSIQSFEQLRTVLEDFILRISKIEALANHSAKPTAPETRKETDKFGHFVRAQNQHESFKKAIYEMRKGKKYSH